ncbi:MAG: WG repeat-containing protein [Clostridia bacterium]|nr:WG repeat-containing protein [Clostridia bacterium]
MNALKRKFIRLAALVLVITLICFSAGCGSPENGEETTRFTSVEVVELDAETVDYYLSDKLEYQCFVYGIGGKYGTLGENGEKVSEPIFDKVYTGLTYSDDGDYAKWSLLGFAGDNEYLISQDGKVTPADPYGIGFEEWCRVYWTEDGPRMFVYGIEDSEERNCDFNEYYSYEFLAVNAYMSFPDRSLISRVIPVREVTEIKYENTEGYNVATPVYKSEKYGLFDFDSKRMLTDFIYDDCTAFAVSGIFAAKKGDKWGYITDTGKKITGFKYETSYDVKEYDSDRIKMFQPVNGYIVVKSGGKYGMIDTLGKTVAACEYDYLSQVNADGVFYGLKGGVWSRCTMAESKTE